ncbi:MAG: ExbD/TolR family protein [Gammaproteobacteria bacterium]|nr:ExbD/TolR family protein [Gammaproteobacteria bacterium]
MLVLLVIFMITAPLLSQGVKVDLPRASAEILEANSKDPLIATVDAQGQLYLNIGELPNQAIPPQLLVNRAAAYLQMRPGTPVLVRGDNNVGYGKVVHVMTLLQNAGAPSVGLMTDMPDNEKSL